MTSIIRRRFGGCLSHRWEFGFKQSSLSHIARVLRHPALDASRRTPLSEHAVVPSRFRVQVSPATQEPPSKFIPTASGIQRSASRRTLDKDVHGPAALRGHRRPADVQRHHHPNRHRLLPPHLHPGTSRGARQDRLPQRATCLDRQPPRQAASNPMYAAPSPGTSGPGRACTAALCEWTSGVEHGGDGLDLDELVLIAEDSDAHQGAGDVVVSERVPDYFPGRHQVLAPGRCDENPCADDVPE